MENFKTREIPERIQELKHEREDEHHLTPHAGGCWICHGDSDAQEGPMLFDMEFDTYYHEHCLEVAGVDSILEYERGEYREDGK